MSQAKILVVDDEAYVLEVCQRILNGAYDVTAAHSGPEAIEQAAISHFDVLLTDIKMPGMDGLETARQSKRLLPDLVCVTMTGYSTMEMAIQALRLGIDEFVVKPFAPEELTMAIERALEKVRLRQENIRLRSLLPLFEFNKFLLRSNDTSHILSQALNLACREVNDALGIITRWQPDRDELYVEHSNLPHPLLRLLQPHLARLGRWHHKNPLQSDGNSLPLPDFQTLRRGINGHHILLTPLQSKDHFLGTLVLLREGRPFTASESNFLSVMASQAANAFENARLFENLQRAYDDLKNLDHLKSEFTNIAAHELRTPLAVLTGYASVLQEEVTDDYQEHVNGIMRNAIRLRGIVSSLLNMRNIETGRLPFNISPVDLGEAIQHVINDMQVLAEKQQIHLSCQLNSGLPLVKTDPQRFETILQALLSNALKFTKPQGRVIVTARSVDEFVEILVQDTGIGIPHTELERIFERFYQVENSLNRTHDGIGLGLSIARGLVKRCGGRIWVDSEEGHGSTFTVRVPLESPPN